jgi:uncharacterized Zn finger protein
MFAIHEQLVRDHVEELIRDAHRGAEAARAVKAARAAKAVRAARSSVPQCAVPNPA